VKTFKITADNRYPWKGIEFEVEDNATEEEIAEAAWEAIAADVGDTFSWEEVQ
jgi:hypothetical protein